MKFANIIREAGLRFSRFPRVSEVEIYLYDDKDMIETSDEIHFVPSLFSGNKKSLMFFENTIMGMEMGKVDYSEPVNVKITEKYVILFYRSPKPLFFARNEDKPLNNDYGE